MSFLQSLGGIINAQFGTGENTSSSLDSVSGGAYANLGAYAKKIDQTAERTYIEDGFIRDIRPRKRSVLFQQPDFYIVIKKRMFSTLVDNSNLTVLEKKERILIAATKRLFQNKCRILSAYEKLTKIEQLTFDSGRFNTFLAPALLNLIDSSSDLLTTLISPSTKAAIDTLRKVISYSQPGAYTNWTTNDYDAVFGSDIGEGPGTFELTNAVSVKTMVSTEWGAGSASVTLEDPYNLLTITENDIDQALTDVTNPMRTGSYYVFVQNELQKTIDQYKADLAVEREARGASQITFKISSGTLLSKRVRAILDDEGQEIIFEYSTGVNNFLSSIGSAGNVGQVFSSAANVFSTGSVTINPQFLAGNPSGNIGENNQLTASERKKFEQIISDIFTMLGQNDTSQREMKTRTLETNYARNRMRLFFNGKYMIQPMDTITIWMTSRTGEDMRLPGGFKKQQNELGLGTIQKFDTIINNINGSIDSMKSSVQTEAGIKTSYDDLERLAIVGPDMPRWLWRMFRQDITGQPTGPSIFSGIVGKGNQGVTGNWSDGKWTVNFTCEDNTGYFDKSMVNFKPSSDVFNASIYDPLTPFDVSFDAATGAAITDPINGSLPPLLKENQDLLDSGMLIFRSGPNKGTSATQNLYTNAPKEISFDTWRSVLHDPPGLVYRWKQGIQSLTFTQRPNSQTNTEHERAVLLTAKPFAGQDVMNVLSLLITGTPYNYSTFLKAAIENGNSLGARDGLNNIPAASTYIQGLLAEIERNNLIWGNFVPHKQLVVNEAVEQFIAQQRLDVITQNSDLNQKLNELARTQDQQILQQQSDMFQGATSPTSVDNVVYNTKIQALKAQIQVAQASFTKTLASPLANNPDIGLTVIGNDINSDPSTTDSTSGSTEAQKQRDALQLRQRLFAMTARRFWQVRANQDKNLFIVDDQYDKNFDIMAFERKIGNTIELFNSQYSNIGEQISQVKKLLGLECFANTQGHIIARPPGYNKVPSSVFYKMFLDRNRNGVKVFPDFLESLFFNQIKDILTQIEITEDNIRLRGIALGAVSDQDIITLIGSGSFNFITNGAGSINLLQFSIQSNPDLGEDPARSILTSLNLSNYQQSISNQVKNSKLFTASAQVNAFSANLSPSPDTQTSAIETVRDRLRIATGTEPPTIDQLFGNPQFTRIGERSQTDKVAIIGQIAQFISQRQSLLKSALNAIKNLKEGVSVNSTPDLGVNSQSNQTVNAVVAPSLNRKTTIPQILEHMIEYEDQDDLGPDSGRRFIITADRIVSLTISENPPPFTMVSVNGLFGQGFTDPPGGLKTSNDGNAVTSAYAVDYDMWYQYGFRAPKPIEAPFFNDPDSQCAPYAVAALLEARENILQGSVSVAGYNEYYQPGDVVYIEDRNLLFYVKSVSHSFSYGNLSTTLELNYGHSPGEYIPTMLDIVGKILYTSKGFFDQHRTERLEMLGSARSIGALTYSSQLASFTTAQGNDTRIAPDAEPLQLLLNGRYGERNKNILNNILFSISGNMNQVKPRQKPIVKIVYYSTTNSFSPDMLKFSLAVKDWLINPQGNDISGTLSSIKLNVSNSGKAQSFGLNASDIIIEEVDFSDTNNQTRTQVFPNTNATPVANTQGPSSTAISTAKAVSVSTLTPDNFRLFLANTIIDVFVDFQIIPITTSSTSVDNQAAQAANATVASIASGSSASSASLANASSAQSSAAAANAAAAAAASRNAAGGG